MSHTTRSGRVGLGRKKSGQTQCGGINNSPTDALVMFSQGACILNMLRDFLSPEAFEIGIIRYLKRFSYQNTVSQHLWESLSDVSVYVLVWLGQRLKLTEMTEAACLILTAQKKQTELKMTF